MAMYYCHRVPRPPLDAFISSIWLFRDDPRPHALKRVLPTGAAQLIINLKEDRTRLYDPERPDRYVSTAGTILAGVQSRYQIIDASEQEYVAGVAFRSGGTAAFLRSPHTRRVTRIRRWSRCGDDSEPPISANSCSSAATRTRSLTRLRPYCGTR